MRHDICRSEISLTDAGVVDDWNAMIRGFLAHGTTAPVHLTRVIDAAPDFALAQACKGLFCLMLGRREMVEAARNANLAVQAILAQGHATARERAFVAALDAWLQGRPTAAIGHIETVLQQSPQDTLAMKISHAIRFMIGDSAGMRRSVERVLGAHDDHPLKGYVMGCHAFTLEETGAYEAAERTGRGALVHAADDAWGLHAVAHVCDMTHRPEDGIALIDGNASAWSHCNNFRFHVWWHKALLHLDRGEIDIVLGLYDTKIRHEKTDDYRDFSNASSLLMRLGLEGVDVGDRWEELADLAENRTADGCLVFADLHYMLALTGDDRPDAAARLAAHVAQTATPVTEAGRIFDNPGIAAAEGLAAFGEGRYDTAFQQLAAARPVIQSMGGSHAQRDVFERITVDAGIRAGRLDAAGAILGDRTALRAGIPDSFAASRMETIAKARAVRTNVAAQ